MTIAFWKRSDLGQQRLNAAADAARDAQDWVAAASLYEVFLSHPAGIGRAGIWIQLGHARKEAGQFGAALEAYRRGLELEPGSADNHLQLGHVLKLIGDTCTARASYKQALLLDPTLADARLELERLDKQARAASSTSNVLAKTAFGLRPPGTPGRPRAPGPSQPARPGSGSQDPQPLNPVTLILASALFDPSRYAGTAGMTGTDTELAWHYLTQGEQAGLKPSALFDPAFYRSAYQAQIAPGTTALVDYLMIGQGSGRYVTRARLDADTALLLASRMVGPATLKRQSGASLASGFSAVEEKLLAGARLMPPRDRLDEEHYEAWYPESARYPGGPTMHYLRVGQAENRVPSMGVLMHRSNRIEHRFDADYYRSQMPPVDADEHPLTHYLLHGLRLGLDPAPDFSAWFYLQMYPDLDPACTEPFEHFLEHGEREGRAGAADFSSWYKPGNIPFDPAKRTILIACHEASRTGAPLLGLSIGKQLSAKRNIIFFLPRGGEIAAEFERHSCLTAIAAPSPIMVELMLEDLRKSYGLEAVIINSMVVGWLAASALCVDMASVALSHEFTEYLPSGLSAMTTEAADCVVVPAEIIRESLSKEILVSRISPANNVVVRSQGCLPDLPETDSDADFTRAQLLSVLKLTEDEPCKIVLGAGFAQIRKGVDLFVQAAAAARTLYSGPLRFVWVGHYDPNGDHAYGVWVHDMMCRLGVKDIVAFVPQQSSLDVLFAMTDVFFLPSRMDPFPNVVLDAFRAGKPVVCFENASGFVPYFKDGLAKGAAVPFCDVPAAAAAIVGLFEPGCGLANRDLARSHFSFAAYADFLLDQVDIAQTRHERIVAVSQQVEAAGWFDTLFVTGTRAMPALPAHRRAIRSYVARGMHGMTLVNPRPGFNERAYWAAHGLHGGGVGLARADKPGSAESSPGRAPTTHVCLNLEDVAATKPFTDPVALHLHLHYPELSAEIRRDLETANCAADLFITTASEERRLEIQYAFRRYLLGDVTVIVVPNRGRDIGPFVSAIGPRLQAEGYGLVGHFHGKRSLAVDAKLGSTWRTFLFGTLLGSPTNLRSIQALFAEDPKLGLVFAEDRHTVGWTENKPVAEALAARLGGRVKVPAAPVFPIGTMFWARPAALSLLMELGITEDEFPLEPTPNDGTILHAMERMLPSFCEAAGFTWCTVHQTGTSW